jgi:hypothetical protein
MREKALLEAIEFCGGVSAFSNRLKISCTRASNWRNKPAMSIPYEYAVVTEAITRVCIERLSPFTDAANKAMKRVSIESNLSPVEIPLDEIIVPKESKTRRFKQDRTIIVGTDRVLISGLAQFECLKEVKLKKILVIALDLESLLLGLRSIKNTNDALLISEKISIGLRLEQLISIRHQKALTGGRVKGMELHRKCDEVETRYGEQIAHSLGLMGKNYYRLAKLVYLNGVPELVDYLDKKQISISLAAEISSMPGNLQYECIKKLSCEVS